METKLPPEPEDGLSSTSTSVPSLPAAPDSTITPYSAPFTEGEDILVHLEDGLIYFGVVVEVEQEQGQCLVRFGDCTERWSSFDELRRLGGLDDDDSPPATPAKPQPVGIEALHQQLAEIETAWQEEVKLPGAVEEARRQLSYSWAGLEWDEAHQRNSAETYCYCGERGDWYKKMLQCSDCLQWFHQECIRALDHPLLCGDRFWAFTCTLCNGTHEETIKRLDLSMVDALHLVIFNLILSKNQKFHDLESSILPFLKKKMKYLSSNSATFKLHRLDLETISKVLANNKGRFMCGSEAGNQANFWGLRRLTAPWLPSKFLLQQPKHATWKPPGPKLKETLIQPNNKKGVFHRRRGGPPAKNGHHRASKPAMKNPLKRCRPRDFDSDSDASNYSSLDFLIKAPSNFSGTNNPFCLMGPPSSCGSRSSSLQGTPGSNTPGTDTPGSNTPGTYTPGCDTPGSATPGTGTPGSATPGTGTPGSATPGTGTPGSATPGTNTPGTATPGSLAEGVQDSPGNQTTSEESRADLLQSVQAILSTSIEGAGASAGAATPPSAAASLGGDSEPEAAAKVRADLAATSLSSYFAPTARTRLARGERMQVRARRRLLTTGAVAYLLDWEPVAAGDS